MALYLCRSSIWSGDDFTACFRHNYLTLLFPSIIAGISILVLLYQIIRLIGGTRSPSGSIQLLTTASESNQVYKESLAEQQLALPPDDVFIDADEVDDDGDRIGRGVRNDALDYPKGPSNHYIVATSVDGKRIIEAKPSSYQCVRDFLELIALGGAVAASLTTVLRGTTNTANIITLVVWLYALLLASVRIVYHHAFLTIRKLKKVHSLGQTSLDWKLWHHSLAIYTLFVVTYLPLGRSAFIHPTDDDVFDRTAMVIASTSLFLSLLLATGRPGSQQVFLEWDSTGVQPSPEPLASYLSLLTLSWLDPFVWMGARTTMMPNSVWNAEASDNTFGLYRRYRVSKSTHKVLYNLASFVKWRLILQMSTSAMYGIMTLAPTLCINQLLKRLERRHHVDPDQAATDLSVMWICVFAFPLTGIMSMILEAMGSWLGWRTAIRLKSILRAEIYAKVLRRKLAKTVNDATLQADEKSASDAAHSASATCEGDENDCDTAVDSSFEGDDDFVSRIEEEDALLGGTNLASTRGGAHLGSVTSTWSTIVGSLRSAFRLEKKSVQDEEQTTGANTKNKKKQHKSTDRNKKKTDATPADVDASDVDATTNGRVITLVSTDTPNICDALSRLHRLFVIAPVQLAVSLFYLYYILGSGVIPGLLSILATLPIVWWFAKQFGYLNEQLLFAVDKRIQILNEVLQSIRIIKYFAWEPRFQEKVGDKRNQELHFLRKIYDLRLIDVSVWISIPNFISLTTFGWLTLVEGKPLMPSTAFSAMSLFSLVQGPLYEISDLLVEVQRAFVSVRRVEQFLNEEETTKYDQLQLPNVDETGQRVLGFQNVTVTWGHADEDTHQDQDSTNLDEHENEDGNGEEDDKMKHRAFRLWDLNFRFALGKINIVIGPTGSGKSSLLLALLGEMTLLPNKNNKADNSPSQHEDLPPRIFSPGTYCRTDVAVNPVTGLTNTIAYAAQSAWIANATIRDNITFHHEFEEDRYLRVIHACGLQRDLEILDDGDLVLVGDKGISLSGGQKQRISLARAVYSNSETLLLDDCLSAVDSHTAKWIFRKCLLDREGLMKGRNVVLVTHNIQLCVPQADYIVMMNRGRVEAVGTPQELHAQKKFDASISLNNTPTTSALPTAASSPSAMGQEAGGTTTTTSYFDLRKKVQQNRSRALGLTTSSTVSVPGSPSPAIGVDAQDGKDGGDDEEEEDNDEVIGRMATSKWYRRDGVATVDVLEEFRHIGRIKWDVLSTYIDAMGSRFYQAAFLMTCVLPCWGFIFYDMWIRHWSNQYVEESAVKPVVPKPHLGVTEDSSASEGHWYLQNGVNAGYYLCGLVFFAWLEVYFVYMRDMTVFQGAVRASRRIHNALLDALFYAKVSFFDTTANGKIVGRFSKDISDIDFEIAPAITVISSWGISCLSILAMLTALTPGFLMALAFIVAGTTVVGLLYIWVARDIKRLSSMIQSPVYQLLGESLDGATSIRAYGVERIFMRENLQRANNYSRIALLQQGVELWMEARFEIIAKSILFVTAALFIWNVDTVDAGTAGFALTYSIVFARDAMILVRYYSRAEQVLNSMERVKEYLDMEPEAAPVLEDSRPPDSWPEQGVVEFEGYSTRYRPELDLVLRDVSFRIEAGEKVGIVGRTGAGKSSLTLALFRSIEAVAGRIVVDGVDISKIGLRDLRERITIVPQDPTLFEGTLRSNLDPFQRYTDAELFDALRKVSLIPSETDGPSDSPAVASLLAAVAPPPSEEAKGKEPTKTVDNGGGNGSCTASSTATTVVGGGGSAKRENKNIFLNLASHVDEGGHNISQGQRQLLCLARAMLRRPRVLVMDEATASIDYTTDTRIQQTIRHLDGTTIITIAHRLQTIVDYDKVLVLDHGRVVEYGHPYELLQATGAGPSLGTTSVDVDGKTQDVLGRGTFRGMCESSGDLALLESLAWEAYQR